MGTVRFRQTESRADILLDQPERRNALSAAMWEQLTDILTSIRSRVELRVLVVRGAGDAFSAGADISEFETQYASGKASEASNARIARALDALDELPFPSIAAIRGVCMGGGCALALACDLAIADETARFGINPTSLGLSYSPRDCQRLVARIGLARAKSLLVGARKLDAASAADWGLVSEVVTAERLLDVVDARAENIVARSPEGLATLKRIFLSLDRAAIEDDATLQQLFQAGFRSQDLREGSAAFLARRPPAFKPRTIS